MTVEQLILISALVAGAVGFALNVSQARQQQQPQPNGDVRALLVEMVTRMETIQHLLERLVELAASRERSERGSGGSSATFNVGGDVAGRDKREGMP